MALAGWWPALPQTIHRVVYTQQDIDLWIENRRARPPVTQGRRRHRLRAAVSVLPSRRRREILRGRRMPDHAPTWRLLLLAAGCALASAAVLGLAI